MCKAMRMLAAAALSLSLAARAGAVDPAPEGGRASDAAVGPVPGAPEPTPRPNPFAGNPGALTTGRQLFMVYNCYGCHGGHAGGGMGPSLRDDVWIYGGSDQAVFNSIAQGRGKGMPAWGTLLGEQQIWLLTAYVKSLRSRAEPDPPQ